MSWRTFAKEKNNGRLPFKYSKDDIGLFAQGVRREPSSVRVRARSRRRYPHGTEVDLVLGPRLGSQPRHEADGRVRAIIERRPLGGARAVCRDRVFRMFGRMGGVFDPVAGLDNRNSIGRRCVRVNLDVSARTMRTIRRASVSGKTEHMTSMTNGFRDHDFAPEHADSSKVPLINSCNSRA